MHPKSVFHNQPTVQSIALTIINSLFSSMKAFSGFKIILFSSSRPGDAGQALGHLFMDVMSQPEEKRNLTAALNGMWHPQGCMESAPCSFRSEVFQLWFLG